MSTILELRKKFFRKIEPLDFDLILEAVVKKPRSFILAHPEKKLTESQKAKAMSFIKRRIKHEPLAYILLAKEFYGLDFKVDKNVLVPRPETELMAETALGLLKAGKWLVADVGTGSGCILVTLAKLSQGAHTFIGADISSKALSVAKKNARLNGVQKKITFIQGDLLSPVIKALGRYSGTGILITANLPYLDYDWKNLLKSSESAGLKYEPSLALYGGKDGLDLYRKIAEELKALRSLTGIPIKVLCEIGHIQVKGIKKIFSFAKDIEIKKDHNCLNRLVIIGI